MRSNGNSSGGIGTVGLLGVAFIVLKMCGVIHWSWVWVLSSFWISAAIVGIIVLICAIQEWDFHRRLRKLVSKLEETKPSK